MSVTIIEADGRYRTFTWGVPSLGRVVLLLDMQRSVGWIPRAVRLDRTPPALLQIEKA